MAFSESALLGAKLFAAFALFKIALVAVAAIGRWFGRHA